MQDRFRGLISNAETVIKKCALLNDAMNHLEVPVIVTEQYPKALGNTVPEIIVERDKTAVFEKKLFSMLTDEVRSSLHANGRTQVILCGIEAHVCVLQTALDLVEMGMSVQLVCDAVSSQRQYDRLMALERMKSCGVTMTTTESVLFDLMKSADHSKFRVISNLVKDHNSLKLEDFN